MIRAIFSSIRDGNDSKRPNSIGTWSSGRVSKRADPVLVPVTSLIPTSLVHVAVCDANQTAGSGLLAVSHCIAITCVGWLAPTPGIPGASQRASSARWCVGE